MCTTAIGANDVSVSLCTRSRLSHREQFCLASRASSSGSWKAELLSKNESVFI